LAARSAGATADLLSGARPGAVGWKLPGSTLAKWVGVGLFAGLGTAITLATVVGRKGETAPTTPAVAQAVVSHAMAKPETEPEAPALAVPASSPSTRPQAASSRRTPNPAVERGGITEELAILERARSALAAGDTTRAAQLLGEHSRLKERALIPEAQLLAVELAWARGDRSGAGALASAFVQQHPRSPHARRARSLLAAAAGQSESGPTMSGH